MPQITIARRVGSHGTAPRVRSKAVLLFHQEMQCQNKRIFILLRLFTSLNVLLRRQLLDWVHPVPSLWISWKLVTYKDTSLIASSGLTTHHIGPGRLWFPTTSLRHFTNA
eukprot:2700812-Amphidinium_carterae.1